MAIEIWMTKAGIGDCILIRCGKQKKKVNILIDSGQGASSFEPVLRRIIKNDEKIDLLILTHDDNDHVKGACNLLEKVSRIDKGMENEDIPTGRLFSNLTEEQILFNFGGNGSEALLAAKDVKKLAYNLKDKIDFHKLGFTLADDEATDENPVPNILQLRWEVADNILSSQVIRKPKREELEPEMEHLDWWRKKESFWWAERREGNWNQNCCVLKGRDGRLRSLNFYQLDTVPQAVYDVRVGLPPGGAASPCAYP